MVKASEPAKATVEVGVTSPKACRQASVPRAVTLVAPSAKSVEALRPTVVKVTSVLALDADSAASPPVSSKPSVCRLT